MPDLKINVTQQGAQQTSAQLNQVAAATDKTTQAANKSVAATKGAATATTGLNDAVGQLAGRNNDAKDAIEGATAALKGNEGSLFGVAKLWKGLIGTFAGGAGPLGLVVLGLTAVKAGLDFIVNRSTAARDAMLNFAGSGERTAEAMKAVEDASKKSLASAKQDVAELTEAYNTLNKQIDASAQRVDKLNAAQTKFQIAQLDKQEAEALAKAGTDPAAQQNIQRDFARRREDIRTQGESARIDNTILKAGVEEKAAQDALRGFRAELDEATLATKRAEDELAGARANASTVTAETVNTDFGRSLRDAVKVAEAALSKAQGNEATIRADLQPQIEEASRRVSGARDTREIAEIERRTLETERATTKTTRTTQDKGTAAEQKKRLDALAAEAAAAQQSGDFAAQSAAVAEREKLIAAGKLPADQSLKSPFARTGPSTINGQPLAPQSGGNRINRGADFEQAADDIKATPPLDAAPIAEPVKEISGAVKENAAQSQAAIQQAGAQIAESTSSLPPPPDLSPLVSAQQGHHQAVVARFTSLEQQLSDLTRLVNQQAMQVRNSMPS